MGDSLNDLAIVPVTSTDSNYFLRKVTGLKIDKTYSFKFQWVLEDGSLSDWSPGYQIVTPTEEVPSAPTVSIPSSNASHIPVTLNAFPEKAKRVDIYIIGGDYGTGKVADSFLQAGTKTIAAKAGTYQVSLITVSASGVNGDPTNTFTILITDPTANIQTPEASKTPSVPTSKSVLGAIQVTWDGKQADGSNQPYGFDAAKVYVGTTPTFTPSASNQVDVFNFKNGQNIINIGVGTLVNGVPMTYGVDYYVKIATTNGTDTSTPVSATGNPKQIGKAGSGDIISILADQIETGTLSASSTITVGATSGKHVKLAGTGDPLTIYGSGGVANPVLSYNGNRLTIVGDGTFSGNLSAAGGSFSGDISGASGTFTGGLSVGQGTVGIITNAIGDGTKVTYTAINSLVVGDTVTISGIAQNGPFVVPGSSPVQYYYTSNAYNITNAYVTDVSPTSFKVSSGVQNSSTQSYTSGGIVTGTAFRVMSTGIFKAFAGNIGGWQIDATQIRSSGSSYISLNPLTPKISLVKSGIEKITIDPVSGIVGPDIEINSVIAPSFKLTPEGILTVRGSITSGSSITGATITGSTITSTGGGVFGGTLTISGAYFTQTEGMYIDAPVFQVATAGTDPNPSGTDSQKLAAYQAAATGYLFIGSQGRTHLGQGGSYSKLINGVYNSLNFTINETNPGDGYRGRGYTLFNLDAAEFRAPSQHVSNSVNYPTVVAGAYGGLMTGRTFYYGTSGTSTDINTNVGGNLGDIYFSTV
jgi:hypothetical protein